MPMAANNYLDSQRKRRAKQTGQSTRRTIGYAMRILCGAQGQPTAFDGKYLALYDPEQDGMDIHGRVMSARIEVTNRLTEAIIFPDIPALLEAWTRTSKRNPVRHYDGRPNRPLTYFTIESVEVKGNNHANTNTNNPT